MEVPPLSDTYSSAPQCLAGLRLSGFTFAALRTSMRYQQLPVALSTLELTAISTWGGVLCICLACGCREMYIRAHYPSRGLWKPQSAHEALLHDVIVNDAALLSANAPRNNEPETPTDRERRRRIARDTLLRVGAKRL